MAATATVFLYHWYVGVVPPPTGVGVKVTEVPAQTLFALGAIVTLAGTTALTTIVVVGDVAGLPEAQGALEVITTYTASPFTGVYV